MPQGVDLIPLINGEQKEALCLVKSLHVARYADGLGYDVISVTEGSITPACIEVKSSSAGHIFLSEREKQVALQMLVSGQCWECVVYEPKTGFADITALLKDELQQPHLLKPVQYSLNLRELRQRD
mmetsp:Transcript_31049/g.51466  ORF Transcript_31049/g.51466 Transcript_31049/m.51466 type:complete len:126 (+) Transcript_31049:3-380(+)